MRRHARAEVEREVVLGRAEVREVFKVSQGRHDRRLLRARAARSRATRRCASCATRAVVFDGEIESLRRFKDDVREVAEGFECGIQIAKFQDLKEGDVIEAYALEQRRRGAGTRMKAQRRGRRSITRSNASSAR